MANVESGLEFVKSAVVSSAHSANASASALRCKAGQARPGQASALLGVALSSSSNRHGQLRRNIDEIDKKGGFFFLKLFTYLFQRLFSCTIIRYF